LKFSEPQKVSVYDEPDQIEVRVLDGKFFLSQESFKVLKEDWKMKKEIPT